MAQLPDTKAATVIHITKSILARHGISEEIKSDNGPQFSQEYNKFSREWNFRHTTVSPINAQSNGQVEKSVQIVKRILSKTDIEGSDPCVGFLEYRNTPIEDCRWPAQMLMGKRLKSFIPCVEERLLLRIHKMTVEIHGAMEKQKQKQKTFYHGTGQDLPELCKADSVRVQDHDSRRWHPAIVKDVADTPRSYVVECSGGGPLWCNHRHILKDKKSGDKEEGHNKEVTH